MVRFGDIAHALSGPRQTGRSHKIIESAPESALMLVADDQHARNMVNMAKKLGRDDIRVIEISQSIRGFEGPFVADHYTIQTLLFMAGRVQEENEWLEAKLKAYEEGVPIEEHHKDGSVYWVGDIADPWGPYYWSDEPNHWGETGWFDECYRGEHTAHRTALPVRVFYPLPPSLQEGGE